MKPPSQYIGGSSENHQGFGRVSPEVFLPQLLSLVINLHLTEFFPHLNQLKLKARTGRMKSL